jgi:hypothetical protein
MKFTITIPKFKISANHRVAKILATLKRLIVINDTDNKHI